MSRYFILIEGPGDAGARARGKCLNLIASRGVARKVLWPLV